MELFKAKQGHFYCQGVRLWYHMITWYGQDCNMDDSYQVGCILAIKCESYSFLKLGWMD